MDHGASPPGDPDSVRRFHQAIEHGCRQKAELAAELQRAHPEHARLPEVLAIRWAGMTNAFGEADAVIAELGKLVADDQLRADVGREAKRALARACVASDHATNPERIDASTEVVAQDGDRHEFAAPCLLDCVEMRIADPATQRRLWQVAVKRWPDEPYGGREASRWLHLLDMIGKPFVEQLPAVSREWLGSVTKDATDYTVVQVWMGWPGQESGGGEVEALQQLRRDLGVRVRLLGLINGDVA